MSGIRRGVGGRDGEVGEGEAGVGEGEAGVREGEAGVGEDWIQGDTGFGLVVASSMVDGGISRIASVTGTLDRLL